MKRLLIKWLCLASCAGAYAQGYIWFNNHAVGGQEVEAPVFRPDGTGAGAGFTAGLFLVQAGGSLEPLFPTTTFRIVPPWTPYVRDVAVLVPGTWSGDVVTVRMRAWETAAGSYEAALIRDESNDIRVTLHAGDPVSLIGLQGFTMVPEPEPGALLALGGVALLALTPRRRK